MRVSFWYVLIGSLLLWILLPTLPAWAHANLVRSNPPAGAVLAQAPGVVTLEFSEALDPLLTRARLVDADFQVIAEGPVVIDPEAERTMALELPAIQDGVYSVIWQARSAVDGHITNGSVSFSVGVNAVPASFLPPPGKPGPAAALPSGLETILRWLSYLGVSFAAGSLFFGLLVWRPAYRAWSERVPAADLQAAFRLRRLAVAGAAGLIAIQLAFVIFQAWESSQGAFQLPFGEALLQLLGSHTIEQFWLRLILLGMIVLLGRRLEGPGESSARPWWEVGILALAMLFTYSLESHSAATGSALAVAVDWIHLTAMAAWVGGLLPVFLILRDTEVPPRLLVPRFSAVAVASVVSLALTGIYSAFLHVRTVEALAQTTYGRAISIKSIVFVFLISLGAVNLLVLSPRLADPMNRATRWLKTTVRVEFTLGLLLLLAVGLLTGVPPAQEALEAERRLGYVGDYREDGVQIKLWVAPGQAGENEIAVDVSGRPPSAANSPLSVLLRLQMAEHGMGVTQVEPEPSDGGRYTLRGSYLSMVGPWSIEVILRRPGFDDISHTFFVQIQKNTQEPTTANPVPADTISIAAGQELYREYCLPCHGPGGQGDGAAGLALNPPPADLSEHTIPGVHTDGQLFEWISTGYPGSPMPAFEHHLTEEQRWHLVNFIRTLHQ